MKKVMVERVLFIVIISIFLLSGISAVAPNTCSIVARNECNDAGVGNLGEHIIMGLSDSTNAHGEFPDQGTYDYVLCCGFGDGVNETECTETNTIIKLSSSTNAHAESPLGTTYLTKVCYEDLECMDFLDNCPSAYPMGIVSLTSTTNAHIGNLSDYSTKICCKSALYAGCDISSAKWNLKTAMQGQKIRLEVTGTEQCSGKSVSFEVIEGGASSQGPAATQPSNVAFNGDTATGIWYAEYVDDGLLGGNPEYYFNASLARNPQVSILSDDPLLEVTKQEEDYCADVTTCKDYTIKGECESDEGLCNVAQSSGRGIVDCNSDSIVCGCLWDEETKTCGFGWYEIESCGDPSTGCTYGCTLCYNQTSNKSYCNLGAGCPVGENPESNGNGICDSGEGCLSDDCVDGDQDTCSSDTYCLSGKCSSVESPPISFGSCKIMQVIENDCDEEPVGSKTIKWNGEWTGEGECGTACQKCKAGGESTVPCPAQIQLPFDFNVYTLIAAIAIIVAIYIYLMRRKKSLKKKTKKKRKKRK